MVSESDIFAVRQAPGLTAATLMNRPALTIHPTEPITAAARRLRQEGIRRLFVVDTRARSPESSPVVTC